MLVVSVPLANERQPLQGVPGMEDATEDSMGGSDEGDQAVEEQVDSQGPAGGWEMWVGSA